MELLGRQSRLFRGMLAAAGNFAAARLRGLGSLPVASDWERRAAACEQCHLRVIRCGVSYCGRPFVEQMDRDPVLEGCGCPCREKAKSPREHCPLDAHHHPARIQGPQCNCKWCMPSR